MKNRGVAIAFAGLIVAALAMGIFSYARWHGGGSAVMVRPSVAVSPTNWPVYPATEYALRAYGEHFKCNVGATEYLPPEHLTPCVTDFATVQFQGEGQLPLFQQTNHSEIVWHKSAGGVFWEIKIQFDATVIMYPVYWQKTAAGWRSATMVPIKGAQPNSRWVQVPVGSRDFYIFSATAITPTSPHTGEPFVTNEMIRQIMAARQNLPIEVTVK